MGKIPKRGRGNPLDLSRKIRKDDEGGKITTGGIQCGMGNIDIGGHDCIALRNIDRVYRRNEIRTLYTTKDRG